MALSGGIFPTPAEVPLIADMSSDILSRPFDVQQIQPDLCGSAEEPRAQRVSRWLSSRKDFLAKANPNIPTMLRYGTFAKENSLYNTPPTFGIYLMGLVLAWVKEQGGLAAITRRQ